jgi:hypothetical protein
MKKLILAAAMTVALAGTANAFPAVVHNCDGLDSIRWLVEPVRTFANGDIIVAHISTEEPAGAPEHLIIYVAPTNAPISPNFSAECYAISAESGSNDDGDKYSRGFYGLGSVKDIKASYDDKRGLLLAMPTFKLAELPATNNVPAGNIYVRINRANGISVTTEDDGWTPRKPFFGEGRPRPFDWREPRY